MSDLLTHWAVFDDCRRLLAADARIHAQINQAMKTHVDDARLGALTRSGARLMPLAMEGARRGQGEGDPKALRKLAFGLGLVAHYAADAVMKPMMSRHAQADWNTADAAMQKGNPAKGGKSIREVSAYYDTHVFRKVYADGRETPFGPAMLAANASDGGNALEAFVRSLFQRALLSSHTLSPDRGDMEGWIDRLLDTVQPLYISIEMYVDIYCRPDPRKMQQYGVETEFYRESDPAIATARKVQRGGAVSAQELDLALAPAGNLSGYGQCLCLGMAKLREASRWWAGAQTHLPSINQ